MDIQKFKETVQFPLRQSTLCFLIRDDEILLAMKKEVLALEDGME
jgi:hypothetical protein